MAERPRCKMCNQTIPLFKMEVEIAGENTITELTRRTPIADSRLRELARWSCGDVGSMWAQGDGKPHSCSPAMAHVLRCIGALDDALGTKTPLPPNGPVNVYVMGDKFCADLGLRLGGMDTVLHIELLGTQYIITDTSMTMQSLLLGDDEAFALAQAIIDLKKSQQKAVLEGKIRDPEDHRTPEQKQQDKAAIAEMLRQSDLSPEQRTGAWAPQQLPPLPPNEQEAIDRQTQTILASARYDRDQKAKAEMARRTAEAAKAGLAPSAEEIADHHAMVSQRLFGNPDDKGGAK